MTAPRGFRAAGAHVGLKKSRPDLALLVSDTPASAAAVFTRNQVKGAPLLVTARHLQGGRCRAVVINSGNANACTGPRGTEDAACMAAWTAAALGLSPLEVAVASTGVIGVPLPMERLYEGIPRVAAALSPTGGGAAARAILTTDTVPKEAAVEVALARGRVRIGGMAKGSGMIHPDMATMLAFLTTDAALAPELLAMLLRAVVEVSFNRISVDGDTSTNDMVLILANGASGTPPLQQGEPDFDLFAAGLHRVAVSLARAIARDGEGATRLIEVTVAGTASEAEAARVARTVVSSNLVKTAVHGADANWGRILAAAGRAGVPFVPEEARVSIGPYTVYAGAALPVDEAAVSRYLQQPEVSLELVLGQGPGQATAWGCDLSPEYVRINASYRS